VISLFKDEDVSVWVPVANGKGGGAARAFLPFNGRTGTYRYGYKASPSTGIYFDALRDIQQSFIDDEHQVFVVNSVKKIFLFISPTNCFFSDKLIIIYLLILLLQLFDMFLI